MAKIVITYLLFLLTMKTFAQASVDIPITVNDGAGNSKVLNFGLDPTATDGIDLALGEGDLPPVPPIGSFDARFVLPAGGFNGTLNSWKDYRSATLPFAGQKEHRLKYQRGSGTVINILYNLPPSISITIKDILTGTIINTTLSGSGSYQVTNPDVFGALKFLVDYTYKTLNLTALIEGFYDGSNMIPDTVTVELHNAISPYSLVEQTKVVLNTSGAGTANFYSAVDATNYYLVVKSRNAVETWSSTGQQFTSGSLSYDFTTASSKAYSDGVSANLPMKQIGSKWCFWSGEVTNSYFIEFSDLIQVYNFYLLGLEDPGWYVEDVTGNGYVEFDDLVLVYNNYLAEIWSQNPLNPVLTARPIKVKEVNNNLNKQE